MHEPVDESFPPAPAPQDHEPADEPLDPMHPHDDSHDASPGSPDGDSAAPESDAAETLDRRDRIAEPDTAVIGLPDGERMQPVPWTPRQTLIGAALTLGPWLLFAIGSQLVQLNTKQPAHPQRLSPGADLALAIVLFIISAALETIFLIAPLWYAARTAPPGLHGAERVRAMLRALGMRRVRPKAVLGMPPVEWAPTAIAVGSALAVIFVSALAYEALRQALHLPLKTNADVLLEQAKYEPYTVIAILLVAVLVAPICEETFFRGFVFPGLARALPIWGAVVTSALLFGLAHADLGSFVVLVAIGIVLAVVRWRTDSLWPGVIVHTLNNTISFVSILVLLPR